MNNDDDFIRKITAYLDAGAAQMKPAPPKLQQAIRALARMAAVRSRNPPCPCVRVAGRAFARQAKPVEERPAGSASRRSSSQLHLAMAGLPADPRTRGLDAQLLSSDLPIDAYLDRGFQNWLTRREPVIGRPQPRCPRRCSRRPAFGRFRQITMGSPSWSQLTPGKQVLGPRVRLENMDS
jgi:hypothetical protein